ncbi:MAG: YtxH protein [Patescibacteria group bacterium]|nr:YtxH protein [Patescibacteria group bacterium]
MVKGKNFAIGAAIAGAVGYVAGILTAPKSGKETRKDIKDKAVETKREAEKRLKELHSQIEDLLKQGKEASSKLSDTAKKEWNALADAAVASRDKVRAVLSSIHEGGTDDKDLQNAMKDASKAVDNLKKYLAKNVKAAKS